VARIATDVGADAIFFNNPDLPHTRSEMALPLIGGSQIIGALDVQSTQPNAFTQEDINLFSTLADQVAIAVMNSRAFEETQYALAEAQMVHRQYLQQEWSRELAEKDHYAYEFTPQGLVTRDRVESEEIDTVFSTGEMLLRNSVQNNAGQKPAVLGIPIKLRGETIGIIHLQDESALPREWVNEDIQIVQTIADQVAQALENARLFQQTLRRADRERKVIEISSKIRSTNDPEQMMQIAVEELQHALHASKTQVILNQNIEKPEVEKESSNGSGRHIRSNGNEKSKLV
jgi:GAF domain-containing protein